MKFSIELAEEELEAAVCQEICGAVPTYIVERVEVARDFGNGSGDNGAILER